MSVVQRRVFYAKAGRADEVVRHLKESDKLLEQAGINATQRILTDHMSGRTDRVVSEIEMDSLGDFEKSFEFEHLPLDAAQNKAFGEWFSKLLDMITHAEVDNWLVR